MEFNKIVSRIKKLLLQPNEEWDAVKNENLTVADIYTTYLIVVAAVPAIAGFIGMTVVGVSAPFVGMVRIGVFHAISAAVFSYCFSLVGVYAGAFVLNKLAPAFKSTPNMINALKLVGFTVLPVWAAGVVTIIPMLGALVVLVGLYAIYICYLGLPKLMGTPADKVVPYLLISAVVMIAIQVVAALIVSAFRGV